MIINCFQSNWTARTLLACLGLLAVFIISLFEGSLLSSLLKKTTRVPFRSTGELAEQMIQGNYRVIGTKGTLYWVKVQSGNLNAYAKMRQALEVSPMINEGDLTRLAERVADAENLVYPADALQATPLLSLNCRMTYVRDMDFPSIRSADAPSGGLTPPSELSLIANY